MFDTSLIICLFSLWDQPWLDGAFFRIKIRGGSFWGVQIFQLVDPPCRPFASHTQSETLVRSKLKIRAEKALVPRLSTTKASRKLSFEKILSWRSGASQWSQPQNLHQRGHLKALYIGSATWIFLDRKHDNLENAQDCVKPLFFLNQMVNLRWDLLLCR